ncbi:tetratricopeptide repeat protein [Aetokthonos hydrillicola Thurmond2011]|jgi:tetratricopeptide (TPR) repeat protein|uniref:Tetratricopeptide repeat protein n=1 Tax=Aetokthonos hydrillicola Thurmond2011 TaxID=2712845 RepID=A0AAP5I956_9CYAN|nr:tetratricopeptide repeat protein [Aetokthonos hydrillicola]MBO3460795.1 tetratricopeptide repeat protein [Aetokthonos hydrillicola CCALA 1050]MBW4588258.1 tetratricopeptide repeat protein [Aetokthonos hydrillicola CCALA 1050]MDR9897262.1 tetratricopeptide repeat protein [Aetokthonos hydrillicola Thurmond2011]
MKLELTNWDKDVPPEIEEEYQALVRTLKLTENFGLIFIRCSPSQGKELIAQIKQDIPDKNIDLLKLNEPVDNFYNYLIDKLYLKNKIDILFIEGLECSFYKYEEVKKLAGWSAKDIYFYSWKGVPPVLINLNQQRERFRETFNNICFVFILPLFAIKYLIQRAPDFFDWRSGVFEFPTNRESLEQESLRILQEGDSQKYKMLTTEERNKKIVKIQELIAEEHKSDRDLANLYSELGNVLAAGQDYLEAISCHDQALKIQPDHYYAWNNKGIVLNDLGRYEEAISCYDQALKIQPDHYYAWNNKGFVLDDLGRYEEAISCYDQALKIQPDYNYAWNNKGNALRNLGRYEEAISYYDQALKIQPDYYYAWNNKGIVLDDLGRYEEAISCYDQALKIQPDHYYAWNNKGNALRSLGRYKEAISCYDQALKIQPDYNYAWNNKGNALRNLGRYEEAISYYDQALKIQPDDHKAWSNKGIALDDLGRYEEAISCYDQALKIQPDYHKAWYNKACCYAIQGNIERAIENLQQAINLNASEYQEMAKSDSDFDIIREDERFQSLIQEQLPSKLVTDELMLE